MDSNPDTASVSQIDPLAQFFARFEKRQFFGVDEHLFTGLGISPNPRFAGFYLKDSETS